MIVADFAHLGIHLFDIPAPYITACTSCHGSCFFLSLTHTHTPRSDWQTHLHMAAGYYIFQAIYYFQSLMHHHFVLCFTASLHSQCDTSLFEILRIMTDCCHVSMQVNFVCAVCVLDTHLNYYFCYCLVCDVLIYCMHGVVHSLFCNNNNIKIWVEFSMKIHCTISTCTFCTNMFHIHNSFI